MKITKIINLWLPVVLWVTFIYYLSGRQLPRTADVQWQEFAVKKSGHLVEYAILVGLLFRAIRNYGYSGKKTFIYSLVICVGFAFTDEFHQIYSPGREPAIRDLVFDTIGASFAGLYLWKLLPNQPKKLKILAEKLGFL